MTFVQKSYGECSKDEKPLLVTTSYYGLDDEEVLKMVPIISNSNNNYLDSDSDSDTDIESDNKNVFHKDIDDKVTAAPKTTINTKVVWAMKKLQASYNDNANKIIKQSVKEKDAIKNLNLLMNIDMVANKTKLTPEENPKYSTKPEIIPTIILVKSGKKQLTRNSPIWLSKGYGV